MTQAFLPSLTRSQGAVVNVVSLGALAGGLLQSGNLEYAGQGDLVAVYRDYVADMRKQGWTGANDDIAAQKATWTLRKDNRTCSLEFTSAGGQIRITIKVTQTKN